MSLDIPIGSGETKIARLRERLFLAPQDVGAMGDLAALLEGAGDFPGAIDLLQRVLRVDPYHVAAIGHLGRLWAELGDTGRARHWFTRALDFDPENGEAVAGLAALNNPAVLTPVYIRTLFDQYADGFDAQLTEKLQYRAPALVAACLDRALAGRVVAGMLDLGCGTGLSGIALRRFAEALDGVDLSPGMIAKARERGIYDRLEVAEAGAFLASGQASQNPSLQCSGIPKFCRRSTSPPPLRGRSARRAGWGGWRRIAADTGRAEPPPTRQRFALPTSPSRGEVFAHFERACPHWDIIAAVDMLNYVADLAPLLALAAKRLKPQGLFAGTVELRAEGGAGLTPKRRYAHGLDHLEAAAAAAGLMVVECAEAALRTESGVDVAGLVFALRLG